MFDVTDTTIPCSGNVMKRRHHPPHRFPVVADQARLCTRQRGGLEVPATGVMLTGDGPNVSYRPE